MFKDKLTQLTNVRPSKSENPEVSTTPTNGNVKLNAPAAAKLGVGVGDFIVIGTAAEGIFIYKGSEGNKEQGTPNVGAKLASTNGKNGGSLQFSSENAFRALEGNKDVKKVYSIEDAIEEEGVSYFKLNYVRDDAKMAKKAQGESAE